MYDGRPQRNGHSSGGRPFICSAMWQLVYDMATTAAVPPGALWLLCSSRHRRLLGRFAPVPPPFEGRPIVLQACSVGEVTAAVPIVAAMGKRWPELPVLLTVSTVAGRMLAQDLGFSSHLSWFPFDHRWSVSLFLRRLNPCLIALLETELWPNLLLAARRRDIPIALLNGRLSDKHFDTYHRFASAIRPVLAGLRLAAMQNEEYAERIATLGVPEEVIHISGPTKLDGTRTSVPQDLCDRTRAEIGLPKEAPVLLFGSTRSGDEQLVARCWVCLRQEFPDLRLIVAPRHKDRIPDMRGVFKEEVLLRSDEPGAKGGLREARVLLLDTFGELPTFYAIATVAVIGGSFFPGVNGHNPLESAALGIPTLFGPFMRNFIDAATLLTGVGGACQVSNPDQLLGELRRLLRGGPAVEAMAERGRRAVLDNQGAVEKTLDLLAPLLRQEPSSCG